MKNLCLILPLVLTGCATLGMKSDATIIQKIEADAAVLNQMKQDIKDKCPKMAPIAGLVAKAIAVAANYADVLNDIEEAISAVPDLKQDYDAISCAIKTVLEDYKKFFKAAPSPQAAAKIVALEQALVELGNPSADAGVLCAGSR
jgi:hypothetical protein